jgi:uncharacterized OB-fold protein
MSGPRAVARSIVLRPRYQRGRFRVAGPDEDAFTLAVRTAERLLDSDPAPPRIVPRRLHLVGGSDVIAEDALVSALGLDATEIRLHPNTPDGALAALEASMRAGDEGAVDLVVAVDSPKSADAPAGSASVGLRVEARPGLELGGHLRVPGRHGAGPSASVALARSTSIVGDAQPSPQAIWIEFQDGSPSDWTELWTPRAAPGGWKTFQPTPDLGADPATGLLTLVDRARREWPKGTRGLVGVVEPSGATLLELRATGADPVGPSPRDEGSVGLIALPEFGADPSPHLDAVSEGAYVPKATYLESLPARWRLVGSKCGACGAVTFPPRSRCRSCGRSDQLQPTQLPRRGLVVAAVTTISPGAQPTEFDPQVALLGAYSVVIVEVVPGVRVTAQVTDAKAGSLALGDRVDLELRRLYPMEGAWRYGLKAIPSGRATPSAVG